MIILTDGGARDYGIVFMIQDWKFADCVYNIMKKLEIMIQAFITKRSLIDTISLGLDY